MFIFLCSVFLCNDVKKMYKNQLKCVVYVLEFNGLPFKYIGQVILQMSFCTPIYAVCKALIQWLYVFLQFLPCGDNDTYPCVLSVLEGSKLCTIFLLFNQLMIQRYIKNPALKEYCIVECFTVSSLYSMKAKGNIFAIF